MSTATNGVAAPAPPRIDHRTTPRTRIAATGSSGRASQSAGQILLGKGGLGFIARRGIDQGTSIALQTLEGVQRLAAQQPLQLLALLPALVPEIDLAIWNGVTLGCGPDSVRIKAMTAKADGGSEEAPEGTAAIDALFASLPDEVGTLSDALAQNFEMVLFSGMAAVEAVPAGRGKGVAEVWPVNSLTLRFKREADGKLALYQRQTADVNGLGIYSSGMGGLFVPMPMERFFWSKIGGLPDEPYGRAPFAAALTETLRIIGFMTDLLIAWHRLGMPRYDIGFDFEMWGKYATDVVKLTDPVEIAEFVQSEFNKTVAAFEDLRADDAFFHGINDKVNTNGSGDKWPDVTGIYDLLRSRLIQALKQNPILMGIVGSGGQTEAWSAVSWDIYSKGLMAVVSKAAAPLVRAANLHLRLLGMPFTAEAELTSARTIQRLAEAQAEAIEISNAARTRDEGWSDNDTASQRITGSAAVAEPRSWQTPPENMQEQFRQDERG
jgi:hypothetical protein